MTVEARTTRTKAVMFGLARLTFGNVRALDLKTLYRNPKDIEPALIFWEVWAERMDISDDV